MFLGQKKSWGVCIIDNLPIKTQLKYLSDKFMHGLHLRGSSIKLRNIKLFAITCSNASHLSSAMDIVLGSFRYCVNNPKNILAAKSMINCVATLLWRNNNKLDFDCDGVIIRPKIEEIAVHKIKDDYLHLIKNIQELIDATAL